jgi:hypothetical protein
MIEGCLGFQGELWGVHMLKEVFIASIQIVTYTLPFHSTSHSLLHLESDVT